MSTAPRLSPDTLPRLQGARTPRYDRTTATAGVVHLGIGAFHRAHQAVAFDTLLGQGRDGYAVIGASLRSADVAQQLNPQDGLYGVLTLADDQAGYRVIGAVREVLVAPRDPAALLARMADPRTRIVTLTVTEKGYCRRPADSTLDLAHPDIRHDLEHPRQPRSAIGFLMAMLEARFAAGLPAPVILSCDNLPHNGRLLAALVAEFARARGDAALARRIAEEVRFPSTMVDRIVPATIADDIAAVASRHGVTDHGLVKAEPFSQWVIETGADVLAPLAGAGALLVRDVGPFETMKLRLLNGSHSMLAYLGQLAGCEFVDQAMALPGMDACLTRLMEAEVSPTLAVPADFDLAGYRRELHARFRNRALGHRTWQIAMDGSQKLPQRLLAPASQRLAGGESVEALALAVAAWMRYVGGMGERGQPFDVRDPLAARLAAAHHDDPAATIDALLGIGEVFEPGLAADPRWREALLAQYRRLVEQGARATIAAFGSTA